MAVVGGAALTLARFLRLRKWVEPVFLHLDPFGMTWRHERAISKQAAVVVVR